MSADELVSDEQWVRDLHQSGSGSAAYGSGDEPDEVNGIGEVDVAALMADDDEPPTGPVNLDIESDDSESDEPLPGSTTSCCGGSVAWWPQPWLPPWSVPWRSTPPMRQPRQAPADP